MNSLNVQILSSLKKFCLVKTVLMFWDIWLVTRLITSLVLLFFAKNPSQIEKFQKSQIARIFILLFVAITLYWPEEKNNTGIVSEQLKKTGASILGRCGSRHGVGQSGRACICRRIYFKAGWTESSLLSWCFCQYFWSPHWCQIQWDLSAHCLLLH